MLYSPPTPFLCSSPKIPEISQQRLQEDSYVHVLWFYKTIIASYSIVFCKRKHFWFMVMCKVPYSSNSIVHPGERGKRSAVTDCMYLNSSFWLAEMSCSQITGTASQLSATLHCTFPLRGASHMCRNTDFGALSLTVARKDLYRATAWFAVYFIQIREGGRKISICNRRLHCQSLHFSAQASYWLPQNNSCDPRHLH